MTLEKLAIRFENNLYDVQPWQKLVVWGVEWKRHKAYSKLADVQAELNLEFGSQLATAGFVDITAETSAFRRTALRRGWAVIRKGRFPECDWGSYRLTESASLLAVIEGGSSSIRRVASLNRRNTE